MVVPRCRRHGGHHGDGGGHAAAGGRRRTKSIFLKVVFSEDGVQDGGEGLLAERTLGLVVRPLLDAGEAEPMEAAVQIRQVVKTVQADGTL